MFNAFSPVDESVSIIIHVAKFEFNYKEAGKKKMISKTRNQFS